MTKPECRINDEKTMTKKPPVPEYDLEERTARFGEKVIAFAKSVPSTCVTLPLVSQLVRSATSVGANYCEADDAESRKDYPPQDQHLPKGVARDEALATDDGGRRPGPEGGGETSVAGSQGTEPHLLGNLAPKRMRRIGIRHSNLIRHSDLGIRHCP